MTMLRMEPHDPARMAATMRQNMAESWATIASSGGAGTHVILASTPHGRGHQVASWVAGGHVDAMLRMADAMLGAIGDLVVANHEGAEAEAVLRRIAAARAAIAMRPCSPAEIADA